MTLRAVVFDFDGVIANSEPLHYRAYCDVLADAGVRLSEADYYARYLGYDDVGAFRRIAADFSIAFSRDDVAALVKRKALRLEELERHQSVLFPGAAAAITRLSASTPLAIASGALRAEIVRVLERERLDGCFQALVGAEDTALSKPAPDPYVRAVELLAGALGVRIRPTDCVAIEDSLWGLESARAAGLRTVAVTHTYPAGQLSTVADAVVAHLDELTVEFLGKLT